jgi:hypothetical protein
LLHRKRSSKNGLANSAATARPARSFATLDKADQRRPATPKIGRVAAWLFANAVYGSATYR